MLDRRSLIKGLIAVAGSALLPGSAPHAKVPGPAECLRRYVDCLPEEYYRRLSPAERSRLFGRMLYGLRLNAAQRHRPVQTPGSATLIEHFSPPALTGIDSPYHTYFGDPHGHSRHSDGMRSPNSYYRFAKKIGLDFAVLTDHAEILSPAEWEMNRRATDQHYLPGHFVTLQAYEHTNCVDGNYDIYMLTRPGERIRYELLFAWFNFFIWRPREHTNTNTIETPDVLFEHLKLARTLRLYEDVMAVPHHCSWALAPTNWKYYDADLVHFAEGYSKHGNSILPDWFDDFFDRIHQHQEGASIMDALISGKHLGIGAATDTHGGRPGSINRALTLAPLFSYTGGLTAALIDRNDPFDRQSLWQALKKRRIYGTRVYGLQMSFRIGDHEMGSELPPETAPVFFIDVTSPPGEDLSAISPMLNYLEIIKNGQPVLKKWCHSDPFHARIDTWQDPFFDSRIDNSYLLRVVGFGGDLAWSSPLLIRGSGGSLHTQRSPARRHQGGA